MSRNFKSSNKCTKDFSKATVLRKDIRTSFCYKEVKLSKRNPTQNQRKDVYIKTIKVPLFCSFLEFPKYSIKNNFMSITVLKILSIKRQLLTIQLS